jgi:hypothetical protein
MGGEFHQRNVLDLWLSNVVCKTTVPRVFELTNRVTASFTPVGNCPDSPELLLRPSPATGHDAEMRGV